MFFEALFEPSTKMNYSEEAQKFAGQRIAVQDGWTIQEGPFKGQRCFYIPSSNIGWIPADDLQDLKPISFVRWKEISRSMGY
jgi:hypothetical protein